MISPGMFTAPVEKNFLSTHLPSVASLGIETPRGRRSSNVGARFDASFGSPLAILHRVPFHATLKTRDTKHTAVRSLFGVQLESVAIELPTGPDKQCPRAKNCKRHRTRPVHV